MKYFISLYLLALPTLANAEGSLADTLNGLKQSLEKVSKQQSKKYLSYCGNESNKLFTAAGWESLNECLTDGRIHLVYAHDNTGDPRKWPLKRDGSELIDFNSGDKDVLLDAVYEGAQVYVGESKRIVLCVEAALHRYRGADGTVREGTVPFSDAVCSTTSRIWADWHMPNAAVPDTEYDAELNRYFTNGHREHIHIHHNNKYPTSGNWAGKKVNKSFLQWYIRY